MSDTKNKVHFAAPITLSIPAFKDAKVEPQSNVVQFDQAARDNLRSQIEEVLAICRQNGFAHGAIVAERYQSLRPSMVPLNWGMVIGLRNYAPNNDFKLYRPIEVQWLLKNKANGCYEPDDLYIIHGAATDKELELLLSAQEKELNDEGLC